MYNKIVSSGFKVYIITQDDGWCDEPKSIYYNKHVDLRIFDNKISHETLWRNDDLYDCLLVLGYNDDPIVPGKGSAIFMHVARAQYAGTAGCIGFSKPDLWEIISKLNINSTITIHNYPKNTISL